MRIYKVGPKKEKTVLNLPMQVISPADVSRLSRELESLEDFMEQSAIRTKGVGLKLPASSKLLDELAASNSFNFLHIQDRKLAKEFLGTLTKTAPVIHLSFASDPSAAFLSKLVSRLRDIIHPQLLVRTGLEPSIAAGCILRTNNRQFDFSLRTTLYAKSDLLMKALKLNSEGQT